ncbi:MAG: hypothetical protein GQ574_01685 [Crocinitomix sp.]|nr:hypothetical protein [Crocinitomix sp.]
MIKTLKNTLLLFSLLFLVTSTFGQTENAVAMSSYSLDETQETVRVSIKTSESFIAGANRYVLHIGSRHFLLNEHPEGSLSEIVFFIPLSDYENLIDQSSIVLVYGFYHSNTLQDGEGGQATGFSGKHWNLGKFTAQTFNSK